MRVGCKRGILVKIYWKGLHWNGTAPWVVRWQRFRNLCVPMQPVWESGARLWSKHQSLGHQDIQRQIPDVFKDWNQRLECTSSVQLPSLEQFIVQRWRLKSRWHTLEFRQIPNQQRRWSCQIRWTIWEPSLFLKRDWIDALNKTALRTWL